MEHIKSRESLKGLVSKRTPLKKEYKRTGKIVWATLLSSGKIEYQGEKHFSPSRAGKAVSGKENNGWTFWTIQDGPDGKWITLKEFAKKQKKPLPQQPERSMKKKPATEKQRRSMKNPLIKKIEDCPAELLWEKRYKEIRKKEFKNEEGIYILLDNGELYYVGRASDLQVRLKQHLKDDHKKKWSRFSVYFTKTKEVAKALEDIILSTVNPRGNRNKPKALPNDTDRIIKEMEKIDKKIRLPPSGDGKRKKPKNRSKPAKQTRRSKGKRSLKGLVSKRTQLKKEYKDGKTVLAVLLPSGKVEYQGTLYSSPSAADNIASGGFRNGWTFWKIQNGSGKWITLKEYAQKAKKS